MEPQNSTKRKRRSALAHFTARSSFEEGLLPRPHFGLLSYTLITTHCLLRRPHALVSIRIHPERSIPWPHAVCRLGRSQVAKLADADVCERRHSSRIGRRTRPRRRDEVARRLSGAWAPVSLFALSAAGKPDARLRGRHRRIT